MPKIRIPKKLDVRIIKPANSASCVKDKIKLPKELSKNLHFTGGSKVLNISEYPTTHPGNVALKESDDECDIIVESFQIYFNFLCLTAAIKYILF